MKEFEMILKGSPASGKSKFRKELQLLWNALPSKEKHFHITKIGCSEHELRIMPKSEPLLEEEQKMDTKYKELKPITASAIYEAGDKGCEEFKDEFQGFLCWANKRYVEELGQKQFFFFTGIAFGEIEKTFEQHPKWKKFLLEHHFIEEITLPKTYKAGDKFRSAYGIYRLAVVGIQHLLLLREDGRKFHGTPSIRVRDIDKVTEEEFYLIARCDPSSFTKIEEEQKNESR